MYWDSLFNYFYPQNQLNANKAYTGIEKLTHIVFYLNTNGALHFSEQMERENICTSIEFDIAMFQTRRIYSI